MYTIQPRHTSLQEEMWVHSLITLLQRYCDTRELRFIGCDFRTLNKHNSFGVETTPVKP